MGGFDDLDPTFASRLQAMIAASGGLLGPGSGRRSTEEQIQLRIKNGCPDVWSSPASSCRIPTAIPGRSNHNHGLAMDLVDVSTGRAVQAGSAADQWLRANAANFGLHQAVKGEAWHVEMLEDGESRGAVQGAPGAIGFDVNWMEEKRNPEDELSSRLETIVGMLTGGTPEAQTPEDVAPQIGVETTTIGGEQPAPQGAPPGGANPPGEGVERWRPMVIQALQHEGEDPGLADIVLRRMQQESGGNPTIVNDWDSNAQRGDPSVGLMQVIGATFRAHAGEYASRGQTDPFANIIASMRYAKSHYGSLAAAYNRKGGY